MCCAACEPDNNINNDHDDDYDRYNDKNNKVVDDDDAGVLFAESLCLGKFHSHIRDVFAPQVVRYIDLMESSVAQSVHVGFEKETWQPQGYANDLHFVSIVACCISGLHLL